MAYKIGETVNHITMLGPLTVLARVTVESENNHFEAMYRCRMFDGRISDFFHYELKAREERE